METGDTRNGGVFSRFRKLRPRNWHFGNRLTVMTLVFTLAPLTIYVGLAAQLFRRNIVASAKMELQQQAKALIMLCEAQEALDRLRKAATSAAAGTDAISGASPAWREGEQYRSLKSIILGVRVAQSGVAYVFNSGGELVIQPQNVPKSEFDPQEESANFRNNIRNHALRLPVGGIETIRYDAVDPRDPAGRPRARLAGFGYFKPYDWIVVVGCYEDELTAPYAGARQLFYLMLLLTPAVFGGLVFFASRRMMKPILQLTDAASRIAHGEFQAVKPPGSRDEIGRLTGEFNLMVHRLQETQIRQLQEWNRELERKVAERTGDLQNALTQMVTVEKLSSLGKIAAMVAHELNNPMFGILSYSMVCERVVASGRFDEANVGELRECLRTITVEAERCGQIVKNLLMFAKNSWGEFAEASLRQILDHTAAVIDHSLAVREIALEKRFGPGSDAIWCDASGLVQLFIALIVNAIEAMENGGRIVVEVDCAGDDEAIIKIQDDGRGIPADVLPHIFEPFFSAKGATSNVGLGLSVAYGIVQSHNGRIGVESRLGQGTTFTIALPRRRSPTRRIEETLMQKITDAAESKG
jgi:signal transduction histidine kinase